VADAEPGRRSSASRAGDTAIVPRVSRGIGRTVVVALAVLAPSACDRGDGGASAGDTVDPAVTGGVVVGDDAAAGTRAAGADGVEGTAAVRPEGFDSVTVRITAADGDECEVCMWLADDVRSRGRGLMGVTDLGGRTGMVFVYPEPATTSFYMYSTPTPLSIAWFAANGSFLAATDMEPCLTADAGECARYGPREPFLTAIEVLRGDLDRLGIGPGATATVVPGTRAADCVASGR
jgi:uncharacterized membrane protein (UPF0127 family)